MYLGFENSAEKTDHTQPNKKTEVQSIDINKHKKERTKREQSKSS